MSRTVLLVTHSEWREARIAPMLQAKGYAVDRVAQWLLDHGIHRFVVEVGGELRLAGPSGRGGPWRIAIERPDDPGGYGRLRL